MPMRVTALLRDLAQPTQGAPPNQGGQVAAWAGTILLYVVLAGVVLALLWYLLRGRR